ncbi:MAG: winged helix-turn-helix transcriptional regulator [Humibacter sp.]
MLRETPLTTREPRKVERDCTEHTHALVRDLFERAGDKWSMAVIEILAHGPVRFTAVLESVSGISHRMLTRTLRGLERDGLVERIAYAEMPPRVEYQLTPVGDSFISAVGAFVEWAADHADDIEGARARFDG